MEKARAKTEANAKEIVPALRDIMIANTPDKEYTRSRHYVIVSDGNTTDSIEAAAKLIEGTLRGSRKRRSISSMSARITATSTNSSRK